MRIDEPGHVYALENMDVRDDEKVVDPTHQLLVFVNREGVKNHLAYRRRKFSVH